MQYAVVLAVRDVEAPVQRQRDGDRVVQGVGAGDARPADAVVVLGVGLQIAVLPIDSVGGGTAGGEVQDTAVVTVGHVQPAAAVLCLPDGEKQAGGAVTDHVGGKVRLPVDPGGLGAGRRGNGACGARWDGADACRAAGCESGAGSGGAQEAATRDARWWSGQGSGGIVGLAHR